MSTPDSLGYPSRMSINPRWWCCGLVLTLLSGPLFPVGGDEPAPASPAVSPPAKTPPTSSSPAPASPAALAPSDQAPADQAGRLWMVLIAGIPGEDAQAERFRSSLSTLRGWAREQLDLPPERLLVVSSAEPAAADQDAVDKVTGASAAAVERVLERLAEQLAPDDTLWVWVVAHGNYDGRQAFLHLAGPDAPAETWARWLDRCRCRQQVVWLAGSGSGWFLRPLSREGRILVTATAADDEFNATEFPEAFAEVLSQTPEKLDRDGSSQVSVAELFLAVDEAVERRFMADQRIPTEHAQLDDDGNGRGSERPAVAANLQRLAAAPEAAAAPVAPPTTVGSDTPVTPVVASPAAPQERVDGAVAARCFIPFTHRKVPAVPAPTSPDAKPADPPSENQP